MKGLLPIDGACELIAASLWIDYATARAAARDVIEILSTHERLGFKALRPLNADQERRHLRFMESKEALDAGVRGCWERGECEVWARPGDLIAKLKLIPVPAANGLEFDYEKHTAGGDGLPPLYDLRIRLPPAAPVKRWRKPPPQKDIKDALADILKAKPTLSGEKLATALCERLGEGMTREKARSAIKRYAPETVKPRGRPRKNKSPK